MRYSMVFADIAVYPYMFHVVVMRYQIDKDHTGIMLVASQISRYICVSFVVLHAVLRETFSDMMRITS